MIFDQAFFYCIQNNSGFQLIYFQSKSFFTIRGPIHLLQYGIAKNVINSASKNVQIFKMNNDYEF